MNWIEKHMKGIVMFSAVFIALLFILLEIGRAVKTPNTRRESGGAIADDAVKDSAAQSGYTSVLSDVMYSQLTPEEKALYVMISEGVLRIKKEANESGAYPLEEIRYEYGKLSGYSINRALSAFLSENPDVFWISNTYTYVYGADSTVLNLQSYVSADTCASMAQELIDVLHTFIANLGNSIDEYRREKYIFDFITDRCSYDSAAVNGGESWTTYTIYGALVEGKAVCEGYARAAVKLFNLCGIDSVIVNGYLSGVSSESGNTHMWNLVKIEGDWYHLDITGCDGETLVGYQYFNVTDSQIQKSHSFAHTYSEEEKNYYGNFELPACSSDALQYYQIEGFRLESLESSKQDGFPEAIVSAVRSGRDSVNIYVDPSLDFSQAVEKLFYQQPYLYSRNLRKAEKDVSYNFDKENTVFLSDETTRGITVKLF